MINSYSEADFQTSHGLFIIWTNCSGQIAVLTLNSIPFSLAYGMPHILSSKWTRGSVNGQDSGRTFCSCKMFLLRCSECSPKNSKRDNLLLTTPCVYSTFFSSVIAWKLEHDIITLEVKLIRAYSWLKSVKLSDYSE